MGERTPLSARRETELWREWFTCWFLKSNESGFIPLPETVEIYNAGTRCDMALGPCACGAWHELIDYRGVPEHGVAISDDDQKVRR